MTEQQELPCPSCGYNVVEQVLQRLGRCPECGATLRMVEIEPRDSLARRWRELHRVAPRHPVFTVAAEANLLLLLPALALLFVPDCVWNTWVGEILGLGIASFLVTVPFGAILLLVSCVMGSRRCLLLGLLNGCAAVVVFLCVRHVLAPWEI